MHLSVNSTQILYLTVVLLSYLLPWADQIFVFRLFGERKRSYFFTIILFGLMFYLLAFRDCGVDTPTYRFTFVHDRSESSYDIVFFQLLHFIRRFTSNYIVWQSVMAGITLFTMFYAIERLENVVDVRLFYLFTTIYIYFYAFNYSRMILSVGISILALSFLVTENNIKFIIFSIVGGLIHYSAFAVLVVYILYYVGKKHIKILIVVGIVGIITVRVKPELILRLVRSVHYSDYVTMFNDAQVGIGTIVMVLPYIILAVVFRRNFDKKILGLIYALLIGNVAAGVFGYFIPSGSRIARFTFAFPCIFLPAYLTKVEREKGSQNNYITIRVISIVLAALLYFLIISPTFETIGIMPYIGE